MYFNVIKKPTNSFNFHGVLYYNQSYLIIDLFDLRTCKKVLNGFVFIDSYNHKYFNLKSNKCFKQCVANNHLWAIHAQKEYNIKKGVVFNISHLLHIKILDIYIQGEKVYSIAMQPLISNTDYCLPLTYSKTNIDLKNILILGQCASVPLKWAISKVCENIKVKSQFLEQLNNNIQYDFDNIDACIIAIPLPILLHTKQYYNFNQNDFWLDIFERAKQTIDIFFNHINQCILKYQKPCFVLGFILPLITLQIDIKNGNKFKRIIENINQYIEDCVVNLNNINLHYIDNDSIAGIAGKKLLIDDHEHWSMHNNLNYENSTTYRMQWFFEKSTNIKDIEDIEDIYESSLPNYAKFSIDKNFVEHYSTYHYFGNTNNINDYIKILLSQIKHYIKVLNQTDTIKLIIFDLDNTLIRGSIAEDYNDINTIPGKGSWEYGIKETLGILKARGVLLALCSKNDYNIVKERISLTYLENLDIFDVVKINYSSKVTNILEILQELSLTADSAIFIDDSALERAEVSYGIKTLRVPVYNRYALKHNLLCAAETQRLYSNGEKIQNTYKGILQRNVLSKSTDRDTYLATLNICVTVCKLFAHNNLELQRCFELVNKTNQFNTTGKRWAFDDFCNFITSHQIYYFNVMDNIQDYGIVGIFMYDTLNDNIVQFIMSCRIIGLGVEDCVLRWFIKDKQHLTAEFKKTELNGPCQDFYSKNNFTLSSDNILLYNNKSQPQEMPTHITLQIK